jgi:hypothetical protein
MSYSRLFPDDFSPVLEKARRKDPPQQATRWPIKRSDGTQISLLARYRRMSLLCCGKKLTNVTYATILGWQGEPEFDAVKYFAE